MQGGPGGTTAGQTAAVLSLCALTLAACWPALYGVFVWDDSILTGTAVLREGSGLWDIWFVPDSIPQDHHYWPVTYTSFWLEHQLWGMSAFSSHLINILLHGANTLLLWRLLGRLNVPGAWLAAAVFAIHPVHIEAVAWAMARKDLLATLFCLCAAQVWLRFHGGATRAPLGVRHLVLLAALLLAAVWSKTIAVTLPAALLLLHWWQQGRVSRAALRHSIPLFVLAALAIALDLYLYWSDEDLRPLDYSLLQRVLIAAQALCFYLGKLLWPLDLAVIYPLWDIGAAKSWLSLLAVALVAVLLWRYYSLGRLGRGPVAAMLFFALTLSPVLGFMDFSYMTFSLVADRYQYLASIGPLTLAVAGVVRLAGVAASDNKWLGGRLACMPEAPLPRVAAPGVALILGALIWLSIEQAAIYQDEARFFRHILAHNPQATGAQANLAAALHRQGRMQEALAASRKALAQTPDFDFAHHNAGVALLGLGRHEEARVHLQKALMGRRGNVVSHHRTMAEQALREGRHEEAVVLLSALTAVYSQQAQSWASLGEALWHTKQYTDAITALERAIELDSGLPGMPGIHFLIARAAEALQQPERAVQHYTQALALDPDLVPALEHLGYLQFTLGQHAEALDAWQRLVALTPEDAQAHSNLGATLAELGQTQAARQSLQQALRLDPTLTSARNNLQRLEADGE